MRHARTTLDRRTVMACAALASLGFTGCAGVAGPATGAVAQDYASALRSALEPFTDRLPGYHYRATPLGNFGVGSVYLDDVQGADPSRAESGWFLGGPQNWLAAGLPEDTRREWLSRVVSEGSLGAFQVDANRRRALEASLGVAVFVALGVGARLDFERGAEVSFQAGEVRNRRLNWAEFSGALEAGLVAPPVAEVVRRGDFVIAAADLVLIDYRAVVAVDEAINPSLSATLRAKSLQPRVKDRGVGGSLSLREATRGRFVASSSQPLVAAVLFKRPPLRSKDGPPSADLGAWPSVDLANRSLDAVESRVLRESR